MLTKIVVGIVVAVLAGLAWLVHPVCDPIPDEEAKTWQPPLAERTDTDRFGWRLFRQRDGHWYQCKSWISRQLFF